MAAPPAKAKKKSAARQPAKLEAAFTVALKTGDALPGPVEAYKHSVSLTGPHKLPGKIPVVPFHTPDTVSDSTSADCYLQLWELDFFPINRVLTNEETDLNERKNQWLATFPGVVVRTAGGYQFRPTSSPSLVESDVNVLYGKVTFELTRAGESSPSQFVIPLPEYEGILELAATLTTTSLDRTFGESKIARPYVVRNVEATIRRQLDERKGIAVAFVADYRAAFSDEANADNAQKKAEGQKELEKAKADFKSAADALWKQKTYGNDPVPAGATPPAGLDPLTSPDYKKYLDTDNGQKLKEAKKQIGLANNKIAAAEAGIKKGLNNKEFQNQAEEMISTLPTIFYDEDKSKIRFGFYQIDSYKKIGSSLTTLKSKLKGITDPALPDPVKVSMLAIYSHGIRQKTELKMDNWSDPGCLTVTSADDFVSMIKNDVTSDLVIPLYACNCGRSITGGVDRFSEKTYGKPDPGEEIGAESLGWILMRGLLANGINQATVWAHATAGHTTRNPWLRVFSAFGTADFIGLLLRQPRFTEAGRREFLKQFALPQYSAANAALYSKRLHAGNLIRTMCQVSGKYLPWEWQGRKDADESTPGYNPELKRQVDLIYDELAALAGGTPGAMADELAFTPDRKYLTGASNPNSNPQLSAHFTYADIKKLASPMRCSVNLLKYVQLLRYRIKNSVVPRAIVAGGDGLALEVLPLNYGKLAEQYEKSAAKGDSAKAQALSALEQEQNKALQQVKAIADKLVSQKLLTRVEIMDGDPKPQPPIAKQWLYCYLTA